MKLDIKALANQGLFAIRRYSPEILIGSGVVGTVVGGVMACRATMRIPEIVEVHQANVQEVHRNYDQDMDDRSKKKALTKVYVSTGTQFVKAYWPSVTVEALSIVSILAGNNILRKRNLALAAAYATIDASFKQYRGRVVDRFGEDVDLELRTGGHQEKIEVVETDENGEKKKVKKSVTVVEGGLSEYSRYFAYGEARAAEPNYDYNKFFLAAQERLANNMLRARGFLFLNEVYDMLGIKKSMAGQVVGWVYDKNSDDHGDNYVDFGIREVVRKRSDKPGDYEPVFLLDFNVDGSILDHSVDKGLVTK